jgi:hypothetical protein
MATRPPDEVIAGVEMTLLNQVFDGNFGFIACFENGADRSGAIERY